MIQIIRIRAATENLQVNLILCGIDFLLQFIGSYRCKPNDINYYLVQVDEEALTILGEVGAKTTLRYAVQLLAPAAVTAKICGRTNIVKDDIKDIGELFLDAKSSAVMLAEKADKYMQ